MTTSSSMTQFQKVIISLALLMGCVLCLVSVFFFSEEWPLISSTATPTFPPTFQATVTQPSYCYNGPANNYLSSTIVPAGTVVDVLGTKRDVTDWFMVQGQSFGRCWMQAGVLLTDNVNFDKILRFTTSFTALESKCFAGPGENYAIQTNIPTGWIVVIYGKNDLKADWVLITPHDSNNQCWVASSSLTPFDSLTLQVELVSTLVPILAVTNIIPTDPSQIKVEWRILSYDCSNAGKAIGALIGLDVSGGVPPYAYSPQIPVSAQPGQVVSITVKSNTSDGEPSDLIKFTVPSASDTSVYKCDRPGNNSGPTSPPSTSIPPTTIPPTPIPPTPKPPTPVRPTPTLCWPPGHCK